MIWNYRFPIIISVLAAILLYNYEYDQPSEIDQGKSHSEIERDELISIPEQIKLQIDVDFNTGIFGELITTNTLYNVGDDQITIKRISINSRDDCQIYPVYRHEREKIFDKDSPEVVRFKRIGRIWEDDSPTQKEFYGEDVTINVGNGTKIEWPRSCGKLVNMHVQTLNGETKLDFM